MDFPRLFDGLLKARKLTLAEFARRVGVTPQFIISIRKGERNLPPARVEAWADAFGLKGMDRRDFILLAMLPRCPELVRPYIAQIIGEK